MFIKIVIILLLIIVVASLLGGRSRTQSQSGRPARPPLRSLMLRMALALLVLSAAVMVVHLSGCSRTDSPFHATDVSGAGFGKLAALESLTDHTGRRLASADFSGRVVVVFFGYTQCPDICPTALSMMQETLRLLGEAADRVQVLFVTVDPERDTPELLASYVPWFDPRFLGLYGDAATTLAVAKEFRVFYSKVKGGSAVGYSIDHTAGSYVLDPTGKLRLLIPHDANPQNVAADLRLLLAGK